MFRNFYEYYQWVLSRFNPVYASEIKKLLNVALNFYNDKNYQSFIIMLRKVAAYLEETGKIEEARTTRNWEIMFRHSLKAKRGE